MAVFDPPVYFTRAAPLDAYSNQLIFYDVVDSSIVESCEVLSCIFEAGGDVTLPQNIKLREFKTWLAAINATPEQLTIMPFPSKCTVLKVADALGDARLDDWIDITARYLHKQARDRRNHRSSAAQEAAESLSSISDPLLHRLLATEAGDPGQTHALLDFLPAHLHPAVVAATVTPTNTLEAPLYEQSHRFLRALASMPPATPALLSLDVYDGPTVHSGYDFQQDPMQGPGWQVAAPHIAAALRKQSSITRLRLDLECIEAASERLLAPAIATLQNLQSLHLRTNVAPDTTQTLQTILRALPRLQELSLFLVHVPASLKRPRDDESTASASCSLTDLLAPATQLTSLHLHARADTDAECFAATSPLVLPHLSHLKADYDQPEAGSVAAAERADFYSIAGMQLIACLTAPLTSLDMHFGSRHGEHLLPDQAPHAQLLFQQLAALSDLKHLRLTSPRDAADEGSAVFSAVLAAAPPALAALRQLEHLDVTARPEVFVEALPLLREGAAALTHLRLMCRAHILTEAHPDSPWEHLAGAVAQLPLRSLALELQEPLHLIEGPPGLAMLCARELSRLTALRMNGWACMTSAADVATLARMTHLQKLQLLSADVAAEVHSDAPRAVQSLPALTSLALTSQEDASFPEALAVAARRPFAETTAHAWPVLQELSLELSDLYTAQSLLGVGSCLTRVTFDEAEWLNGLGAGGGDREAEWEQVEVQADMLGIVVSLADKSLF